MKRILLIFIINCSLLITNCLSQWVLQNTGTSSILQNIKFVNENTGWIIGDNSVILKTTNGGQNWNIQTAPIPSGIFLTGLQMFNENTGYIAGWFNIIIKTTNGGNNWVQLPGPSASYGSFNDISFINENTGLGCGFLGIIWKTTNGGLNWDSLNTGGGPLTCIQFLNSQTGWVAGDGGFIRKTTNGGLNWLFQFQGTTSDFSYNSMCFIDINTGWVVGRYYSGVFGTTDGGTNWDTLAMISNVRCLFFTNQLTGWIGGMNGLLYKTTNRGFNWNLQSVPVAGVFIKIFFINDTIGWAANYNKIIKTTNGGEPVGIKPISNTCSVDYKLHQNYPNPFNPNTNIEFEIPVEDNVRLIVNDILGKEVKTIVDEKLKAGKYTAVFKADNLSSGIYFYTLFTSETIVTKKMNLIK